VTKFGVFFDDDTKCERPLYVSAFMTLAEGWAIINESAYADFNRKLVVKPIAARH